MAETESQNSLPKLALIGFGEAGETFARAGGWEGHASGWDLLEPRRNVMAECGVEPGVDAASALFDAQCILSLVTADAAKDAAHDYANMLADGAMFLDMNSVAPGTKKAASGPVEEAGAHYIDVAVMSPVDKGLAVPLLLAGEKAEEARAMLTALGFTNTRVVGESIGKASAIKLCRSVMVKGLEALTAEMVLAASAAGVLDEVLASLDASERQIGWAERADYNFDRMMIHGRRRSAEMAEATTMLHDLGVEPKMSEQTVNWQQGLGELEIAPPDGLSAKLDAIRATHPSGMGSGEPKGEN